MKYSIDKVIHLFKPLLPGVSLCQHNIYLPVIETTTLNFQLESTSYRTFLFRC